MPTLAATASARKSLGEYKALIVYPDGATEVAEKSPERATKYTKYGTHHGNRMARGKAYTTREEAVAAAQRLIDLRRDDALNRAKKFAASTCEIMRTNGVDRALREAQTWGA